MNRLEAMGVLLAVIDAGSLSDAGRKLGMPLATVSRKVSDLEAELKTRLLIRSTRQLTLTEAGRGYVAACRRILEEVHEAERAAAGEYSAPRGDLVVTAPVVFGRLHVLPVLIEFLRAYPEVNVRLVLGDRIVNLLEDHVDLALRIGSLPDSGLVATQLGSIRRVVCASPDYVAKSGVPATPRDLAAHQCISFEPFASANTWRFIVEGADSSVPVHPRLIVSTAEAAIDAAIAGVGITCVLSYQIEPALRAGTLRLLLESFEPPPLPVSFLYSSQGRLPLKLRAMLDFAAPRLRTRLRQAQAALESVRPVSGTKPRRRAGGNKNATIGVRPLPPAR
jgi:DNA-binding transcriptional LysR family regulator